MLSFHLPPSDTLSYLPAHCFFFITHCLSSSHILLKFCIPLFKYTLSSLLISPHSCTLFPDNHRNITSHTTLPSLLTCLQFLHAHFLSLNTHIHIHTVSFHFTPADLQVTKIASLNHFTHTHMTKTTSLHTQTHTSLTHSEHTQFFKSCVSSELG